MPGLFPPAVIDGNVHVDGAVMNERPGDVMRRRCCGTLVVIDVGSVPALVFDIAEFPSPWRLPWSRVLPFARRMDVPGIGAIPVRTTEVSSAQSASDVAHDADLHLRPPIDESVLLEFTDMDEIVETGYRYARQRSGELRAGGSARALFQVERARAQDCPRKRG